MYQEELEGGWTYTRLEQKDWDEIKNLRIRGHGKITGLTNAEGEQHPAIITTEDGAMFTPEELEYVDFDGRHGWVGYETGAES